MKSTSLRLIIIASFVVLLTFATTIPNQGVGSRAIVFNGTNQYARVTLPNSAPWTSLGAFKIMGRLRDMWAYVVLDIRSLMLSSELCGVG